MTDETGKPLRKPPRQVTPAYLQRAALAYLERYASSAENLRRVLRRKVDKRCRLRGEDPAGFQDMIDEVVAKSLRTGLIDDTRYAEARVATLRRRGGSARAIQAKLSAKGVDRTAIAAALEGDEGDEEQAARAFARRRKLGPFRPGERAPNRDKDLAAMARAGFRFDVARDVIDWDPDEDPDG
ncbi:regulatory protein RecX [Microvirga sp. Mcv34]|uniref:regulatory protein RecX n=1 Tax=Microvirga sp. Mcv34 TaxID=2926016 RepID=UPI0021C88099|nr:RecX family transcriptional regulator [Microvirga sp. Mcv34]